MFCWPRAKGVTSTKHKTRLKPKIHPISFGGLLVVQTQERWPAAGNTVCIVEAKPAAANYPGRYFCPERDVTGQSDCTTTTTILVCCSATCVTRYRTLPRKRENDKTRRRCGLGSWPWLYYNSSVVLCADVPCGTVVCCYLMHTSSIILRSSRLGMIDFSIVQRASRHFVARCLHLLNYISRRR